MARNHLTDRSIGRVHIRARWYGRDVVVTALVPRRRFRGAALREARRVRIVLPDGREREAYTRHVQTLDGRPVLEALRAIAADRRAERRKASGANIRRARAKVQAAERTIARHEAHITRLRTAIKAWHRKLAQRERALRELTEREADERASEPKLPHVDETDADGCTCGTCNTCRASVSGVYDDERTGAHVAACMCGRTDGAMVESDDGLLRCPTCGCH